MSDVFKIESKYWLTNQSQGERIVLLHSLAGTRLQWQDFYSVLKTNFDLLVPDQQGHGSNRDKSSTVENSLSFAPLDYAKNIITFLEKENFHPAYLIGHSMGAKTSCAIAHLKPEWTKGIIMVDMPPSFSNRSQSFREVRYQFYENLPMEFKTLQEGEDYLKQKCHDPSMIPIFMKSLIPEDGKFVFNFEKSAILATLKSAEKGNIEAWICEVSQKGIPILLIRGSESLIWNREEYENDRARLRNFPLISFKEIPGAGHGLPLEKAEELTKEIISFINSRPKSS